MVRPSHIYQFGKQKLLLDKFQTPEVHREENWWHLVHLAYLHLWVARPFAVSTLRPWEQYLPIHHTDTLTVAQVQRNFEQLIRTFGTPAQAPKPRGKPPGRQKGTRLPPRKRHTVLRKSTNPSSQPARLKNLCFAYFAGTMPGSNLNCARTLHCSVRSPTFIVSCRSVAKDPASAN